MNQDNNSFIPSNTSGTTPNVQPRQSGVAVGAGVLPAATVGATTNPTPTSVPNTSVSTKPDILICSRCGNQMKIESRYCMKCGNLNYAHPDNESMKQYAWQNIKQGYFISGANLDDKQSLSKTNSKSVSNVSPFRACLITNIILHLLMVVAILFLCYVVISSIGMTLPIALVISTVIGGLIVFILNYSMQAMYIKAGEPWWGYYVPIYNGYILFKIAMGNGWIFLTTFIPLVGIIFGLIAIYNLGKKFYKSGWLTLFFPFIMIPIIGLDKNSEYSLLARTESLDNTQAGGKGKTRSEREYGRNKFFITSIVLIVVGVVIYFTWPYLQPLLEKIYNFFMEQFEFFK